MRAVITGTTSGLGQCLLLEARRQGWYVDNLDKPGHDLTDPESVRIFCEGRSAPVDVLINNAGINGIDWLENVTVEDWDRIMNTNARAIFLMVKGLLPQLKEAKGTVLNITSNAAWVPMTNSLAYNASKAAAHIMTLQLARELTKRHGITVLGVAPNKLEGTGMSRYIEERVCGIRGWTPEQAKQYQLNALTSGEETKPERLAEFIVWLLSDKSRHKHLSGCIFPYGA